MSKYLICGHPYGCLEDDADADESRRAPCGWCKEVRIVEEEKLQLLLVAGQATKDLEARDEAIEDLERDNKDLRAVLDKKAIHLEPGEYTMDVREIGYLVMYPGATMYTPDDRTVRHIQPPPNAETTAKSEPTK